MLCSLFRSVRWTPTSLRTGYLSYSPHSGNWGTDLQSGSQFGYKLLFVVLVSGLIAVYLQVLASRLGCVTGLGTS